MESLRRTRTGYYRANEVDRHLLKIKIDYEECLREQKERILGLRKENRELVAMVEQYRMDSQYVSEAISLAEQTAKKIVEKAELEAMNRLVEAEARSHQMHFEALACIQRLMELKKASESVYMAACKALPDNNSGTDASIRTAAQTVLSR